jgi:hypothetical protein
LITYKVQALIW